MDDLFRVGALRLLQDARRHRFMEASDFTAAARRAHEALAPLVASSHQVQSTFIGYQMDPVTPGAILAAAHARAKMSDERRVRAAVWNMLHEESDKAFALVAFANPFDDTVQDAGGVHWPRRGIALSVASVDRTLTTFFDIERAKGVARSLELRFRPLDFVRR